MMEEDLQELGVSYSKTVVPERLQSDEHTAIIFVAVEGGQYQVTLSPGFNVKEIKFTPSSIGFPLASRPITKRVQEPVLAGLPSPHFVCQDVPAITVNCCCFQGKSAERLFCPWEVFYS
jgi:hypothetical protein